ncbi:DEAD/DEAH box helicase [Allorhizocola rhizosphaerae]|uniref:DEAD/DEAH box helicase n=1 Tax=Allorhizocola rhizosphaerae TaxID=1872709 RepID=UPI000E3D8CBC|nr:DEAD/DEAH box helicase [Allorhizocola rhizosphaerae]
MAVRRPRTTTSTPITTAIATAIAPGVTFTDFDLPKALITALSKIGITDPFPIQAATLPDALAGRDVLGRGSTGSGKTYAFALPLLARLAAGASPRLPGRPRALILVPTRELAMQIESGMAPLAKALSLRTLTIFGGVSAGPQIAGLRAGVDVLIACPGRLEDHIATGRARLDGVEITVLDEADHMADLGFLPAVRRLLELTPRSGQRMLFSATLDAAVDVLVRRFLKNPVTHSVDSSLSPVTSMVHHMLHVSQTDRLPVLVDLATGSSRTLVFTRTKHGAKSLTRRLVAAGVPAVELHGNLAQNARTRNLDAFTSGTATALVATDIAARGIHVDGISLVIHADPPVEHKAYLHRSGRTARAGAHGTVVTLVPDDRIAEISELARRAGIKPITTRLRAGDPLLAEIAPGSARPVGTVQRLPGTGSTAGNEPRSADTPTGAAAFSARSRAGRRRGRR